MVPARPSLPRVHGRRKRGVKQTLKTSRHEPVWLKFQWVEAPFGQTITHPRHMHRMMYRAIGSRQMEIAAVLGLDHAYRLLVAKTVALGDHRSVQMPPSRVFRAALRAGAPSIILAHNHPSGRRTPSGADILLTDHLAKLGDQLEIPVLDHWIVTQKALVSLAERGLMARSPAPWAA